MELARLASKLDPQAPFRAPEQQGSRNRKKNVTTLYGMGFRNFFGNNLSFGRTPTGRKRLFSGIFGRFEPGALGNGPKWAKMGQNPTKLPFFCRWGSDRKKLFSKKVGQKCPQRREIVFLCFPPGPRISPSAKGPKWAAKPTKLLFPAGGSDQKESHCQESCRKPARIAW